MNARTQERRPPSSLRLIMAAIAFVGAVAVPVSADSKYVPAVTIGAQLEGGGYYFMPSASLLVSTTLPIRGANLEIAPNLGLTYIFFPTTGLSGSWYIPVGAELRFPKRQLGIVVRNLVALANILGEGGVTAAVEGYVPIAEPGRSLFSLAVSAGTSIFWNTATHPLFLVSLSLSFRYDYQLKILS